MINRGSTEKIKHIKNIGIPSKGLNNDEYSDIEVTLNKVTAIIVVIGKNLFITGFIVF